jgi:hypothetical protein
VQEAEGAGDGLGEEFDASRRRHERMTEWITTKVSKSTSVRILNTEPVTTPASEWRMIAYSKIQAPASNFATRYRQCVKGL